MLNALQQLASEPTPLPPEAAAVAPPPPLSLVPPIASTPPPDLNTKNEIKKSEQEYVNLFNAVLTNSRDARRYIQMQWDVNWALYRNQYDFRNKLPWQHRGWVSQVSEMIDAKRAAQVQALLKTNGYYFEMEPQGTRPSDVAIAAALTKVLRAHLNYLDFDDVIFPDQITMANLAMSSMKVMATRSDRGYFRHKLDPIPAWDYYKDPLGLGQYVIHISRMDLSEFKQMALERGSPYIQDNVRALTPSYPNREELDRKLRREGIQPQAGISRSLIEVAEYHGNLDDLDGKRLHTNCMFTIVNRMTLVRWPQKNSSPLERKPFVDGSVRRTPFSPYPKPPVSDISGMAKSLTDFFNLLMDVATVYGIPTFEAWPGGFQNVQEVLQGFSPHRVYMRKTPNFNDQPLMKRLDLGQLDSNLFQFVLGFLKNSLGSHVAPSLELGTPTGGEATATEAGTKFQQLQKILADESKEIEAQLIEPMLELMASNQIWYCRNYRDDPLMVAALEDEEIRLLEGLTNAERMDIARNMRFKARGMSAMLNAQESSDAVDVLLQRYGRMFKGMPPEVATELIDQINFPGLLAFYARNAAVPRGVVLRSDEEVQQIKQQRAQQQQAQMQQQMEMQQQQQQAQAQQQQMALEKQNPQFKQEQSQAQAAGRAYGHRLGEAIADEEFGREEEMNQADMAPMNAPEQMQTRILQLMQGGRQ